jgi:diacylglycerol kinase (ATP)
MPEIQEIKEIPAKKPRARHYRAMRAKLIFNPSAGAAKGSPIGILDVIHEMQAWKLVPEAFLVEADCDLPGAVRDALAQGIRMFVVCGGDGTICAVARILAGTGATLGIIPIGTQNNTALSLGIPADMAAAIAILRTGRHIKVDIGMATHPSPTSEGGEMNTPFLELCAVGLVATLFPSTDDVQHGNLARVGDFLATLVNSPPAEMTLVLDGKQEVHALGHVVLVTNMPYIGRHYMVGAAASFRDGLLDVLFFADLSKLDLVGYMLHGVGTGNLEDPRIQHFHVRRVDINTQPAMPIMADGIALGEGRVRVEVRRRVLAVMVGKATPEALPASGESLEVMAYAGAG